MLKHLLNSVCIFSVIFLFSAVLPLAADTPPTPLTSAGPAAIDLLPLKKALAPLSGNSSVQTHTSLQITVSGRGTPLTIREELKTTARRPGLFHAEITQFSAQGTNGKRLVLVSNGASVWIYHSSLRQYSTLSTQKFKAQKNAVSSLGLLIGGLYLGGGYSLVQGFRSITPSNSADVLAELGKMDITLTREIKSVANQDDYVYSLTLTRQNLAYKFYVDSATNTLTRIDLTALQDGAQVDYREDVSRLIAQEVPPKAAFIFTPPPGTLKTAFISLSPNKPPTTAPTP